MTRSADDLPPALPSLWRTVKLGYRAEPRGLLLAFAMTVFAALPDALIALWLKFLADGFSGDHVDRKLVIVGRARPGVVGSTATWFLRVVFTAHATPLPRQDLGRARSARRHVAGVGRDDRAPRAPRVPRPAGGAARPGVRARPPLHVAVLDRRLARPPGRDAAPAHDGEPGARVPAAVRDPDRHHEHLAARHRAAGRGVGGAARPARPPLVPARRPPRRPARSCASRASANRSCTTGASRGTVGTTRSRTHARSPRCGTRSRGRSSAARTSARSSTWQPD